MNKYTLSMFLIIGIMFILVVIAVFSEKNTPDTNISYMLDEKTGLCFAYLKGSISEVPCSDRVMSEIFIKGR